MDTTRKIVVGNQQGSQSRNQNHPHKNPKKKKNLFLTILKYFILIAFIVTVVGAVVAVFYVQSVIKDLEDIDPNKVSSQLYENSVIIDSQGRVLENIRSEGLRKVVKYEDISPAVVDAFIAVEDKTFLTHNGFNLIRMVGATLKYLLNGETLGGVSTITQQLARNVYLFDRRQERSLKRKIEEAYYTIQLEKYLTKEQIMEGYLNLIFFGMESYGVEAAAQTYFGKSVKDLDYIEAALLVGTVKAPSYYSPMLRFEKKNVPEGAYIIDDSDQFYTIVFNSNCVPRYEDCLYLMHENGKITDQQYKEGLEFDVKKKLKFVKLRGEEISSYFSDIVVEEALDDLMTKFRMTRSEALELLTSGGLKIESTIDFDMQKTLEKHFERDNFTLYYNNDLSKAVSKFQEDHGMEASGKADSPTLDLICEKTGSDRSLFSDEYYDAGEESEAVQTLKYLLNKLGYFVTNEFFPDAVPTFNADGNILDPANWKVILKRYDNIIDAEGRLIIPDADYEYTQNGSLVLHRDGPMEFYPHYNKEDQSLERIQIVVDKTFKLPNGYDNDRYVSGKYHVDSIHIYYGRDVLIPDEFKKFDDNGNVVVSKQFLKENPDFFVLHPDDGSLRISPENFVISNNPIIQPQAAMTIVDNKTGELKALVGGRNLEGYSLYNRATNPRQPGSAIKPISVYTAAMDSGKYSPSSVIDDRPVYLSGSKSVRWPVNWCETGRHKFWYHGLTTIREAFNQSSNVIPGILADELGVENCINYLKNYGVTSIVEEGPVNDVNVAAMSVGAMSLGISPLEMTQAYACIANDGMLNKITTVKRITNNRGEVLIDKTPNPTRVLDPKVAYLLKDLLRSSVSNGLAHWARLNDHPVYGKTGTTTNDIDIWFVGFTPYYTGAVWFGNDISIPLSKGSGFNADFWRRVMEDIHKDLEPISFEVPEGIIRVEVDTISGKLPTELTKKDPRNPIRTDIFIRGFEPTEPDDVHVEVRICKTSGKLASDYCPESEIETKVMVKRPVPYDPKEHENIVLKDSEYDAPTEVCDIHNEHTHQENMVKENLPYVGLPTLKRLATGDLMVLRPYPIHMMDGKIKIVGVGTIFKIDGNVTLPDGREISDADILKIEQYSAEELDAFFSLIDSGNGSHDNTDGHDNTGEQGSNPSDSSGTDSDEQSGGEQGVETTPSATNP